MNTNQTTPSEALAASVHAMLAGTSGDRPTPAYLEVLSLYDYTPTAKPGYWDDIQRKLVKSG